MATVIVGFRSGPASEGERARNDIDSKRHDGSSLDFTHYLAPRAINIIEKRTEKGEGMSGMKRRMDENGDRIGMECTLSVMHDHSLA